MRKNLSSIFSVTSRVPKIIEGLNETLKYDLVSYHRGDSMPVKMCDNLIKRQWKGGEFVRWTDSPTGEPTVDIADGRYCGFFGYGAMEEVNDNSVLEGANLAYGNMVMYFGGCYVYTRTYEKYGYLARHGLAPMTPLIYKPNQSLYISENGKTTVEDESDFTIYPVHTFPNGDPITVKFTFYGICSVPPSPKIGNFMAIQTNFGI